MWLGAILLDEIFYNMFSNEKLLDYKHWIITGSNARKK